MIDQGKEQKTQVRKPILSVTILPERIRKKSPAYTFTMRRNQPYTLLQELAQENGKTFTCDPAITKNNFVDLLRAEDRLLINGTTFDAHQENRDTALTEKLDQLSSDASVLHFIKTQINQNVFTWAAFEPLMQNTLKNTTNTLNFGIAGVSLDSTENSALRLTITNNLIFVSQGINATDPLNPYVLGTPTDQTTKELATITSKFLIKPGSDPNTIQLVLEDCTTNIYNKDVIQYIDPVYADELLSLFIKQCNNTNKLVQLAFKPTDFGYKKIPFNKTLAIFKRLGELMGILQEKKVYSLSEEEKADKTPTAAHFQPSPDNKKKTVQEEQKKQQEKPESAFSYGTKYFIW